MNILAIDPGLVMGFAYGPATGPVCGVLKLPGFDDENRARSFAGAHAAVQSMIRVHDIKGVVIEAPLMEVWRKNKRGIETPTSNHGVRMHHMLSGVLQAAVINGGAVLLGMPEPKTWRKAVLGNGYPADAKAAAIQYCRIALNLILESHDAAEAACLWAWGVGQAKLL